MKKIIGFSFVFGAAVLGLALSALASSAFAQDDAQDAIRSAVACRDISDPSARLACLDAAAEALSKTSIIEVDEPVSARKDEPKFEGDPFADTPENFGAEALPEYRKKLEKRRIGSITQKIAEVKVDPFKKVTLTLANGQVWEQLDSDNKLLHFPRKEQIFTAKIKRSFIGNYLLTVPELRRTIRVRRVE